MDKRKLNLLKFSFFCAIAVWQFCLIGEYIVQPFAHGNGFSWMRAENEVFASDFLHYYTSGVMARSVDSKRIYDVPAHFPYLNALIAPRVVTKDSYIQYSPQQIAVMSIVTLIPLLPAYVIWTVSVTVFGATALFFLLKRVGNLTTYQSVIFVIITSASLSSITAMRMGQWTWLLTGLFCCFFLASLQKREILSALYLGLLTFKPQYCLPLMIVSAVEKRFLNLFIVGAIVAALSVWAANLIGWYNVVNYPKIVADFAVQPDLQADALCYCSLRSFFSTFLPIKTAITVTSILYFGALGVFGLSCLLHRMVIKENLYWVWAIAVLVSLIFAPLMFQYDAMLACIPAALTMKTLNPFEINKMKSAALKMWHWIFLCYPVFTWLRGFLGNETNYLYSFVNLALFFCAVSYLRNRTKFENAS